MKTLIHSILLLCIPFIFCYGTLLAVLTLLLLSACYNWDNSPFIIFIASDDFTLKIVPIISLVLFLISIYIVIRKLLKKHDSIFFREEERKN